MTNGARKMEKHGRKKVTKKEVAVLLAVAVAAVVFLIVRSAKKPAQDPTPVTTTAATTVQTTTETTVATTAATTVATTQKPTVKSLPTKPVTTAAPVGNHYVQPEGAVWYLKLANDWNTLPESYDSTFTAVEYGGGLSGKLFDSRAVDALREMLAAGNAENAALRLQPVSCYRSVALQKSLYERQVQKQKNAGYSDAKAREVAATIVKRPGQSEHNTGLAADLGGYLADTLLVATAYDYRRLVGAIKFDAVRFCYNDRMRISNREDHRVCLFLNSVTDTLDFKGLGVTVCYALDHIGYQGSCQAVQSLMFLVFGRTFNRNNGTVYFDYHIGMHRARKFAFGSLYGYRVIGRKRERHACGYINMLSTNS